MQRPHPFRTLKRWLPRGLFWRSLIIIVAPVVLLQCFVSYAFFVRHYDIMTARMARGVAADVAFLVNLEESHPPGAERTQLLDMAARNLSYQIAQMPNESLNKPYRRSAPYVNRPLNATFRQQLGMTRPFVTYVEGDRAVIRVEVRDGILQVQVPIKRLEVSKPDRAAGESRGELRQRPSYRRFQAAWRDRGAPRSAGLRHHARTHRPLRAATHGDAGRREP